MRRYIFGGTVGKFSLFLFILTAAFSLPVYSCSCLENTVEEYIKNCPSIYTARLKSAFYKEETDLEFEQVVGKLGKPMTFYQGETQKLNTLVAPITGASFDMSLVVGKVYLVCDQGAPKQRLSCCSFTSQARWGDARKFIQAQENITN